MHIILALGGHKASNTKKKQSTDLKKIKTQNYTKNYVQKQYKNEAMRLGVTTIAIAIEKFEKLKLWEVQYCFCSIIRITM